MRLTFLAFFGLLGPIGTAQKIVGLWEGQADPTYSFCPEFGYAVDFLGDLDQDGKDDVLIGAPFSAPQPGLNTGEVRVMGASVRTLAGSSAFERYGSAVSRLGFIDGDGSEDFAVGAPLAFDAAAFAGRVDVVSGAFLTTIRQHFGDTVGDQFGYAIDELGDVDGDGSPDYLVGAPQQYSPTQPSAGYAVVLSGADGSELFRATGVLGDSLGFSVAGLGDVTNDGVPDFAIGAPGASGTGGATGVVYTYSGATFTLRYTLEGDAPGDEFGWSVASAGDVDGNGIPDVIVGAPQSQTGPGYARTHRGFSGADLRSFVVPSFGKTRFGSAVSNAGDYDDDGFDDVAVGAPEDGGNVYVFSVVTGATLATLGGLDSSPGIGGWGYSLASGGDASGDGREDVLAGSPGLYLDDSSGYCTGRVKAFSRDGTRRVQFTAPGGGDAMTSIDDQDGDGVRELAVGIPDAGRVQIFSGKTGQLHLDLTGMNAFGKDLDGAGDIDGDGFEDLLVGAPATAGGYVEVRSGQDGTRLLRLDPIGAQNDAFGRAVSGGHDIDLDGVPDIVVGTSYAEVSVISLFDGCLCVSDGAVKVFSGATGALIREHLGGPGEGLGASVALLPDITGDGRADYIVGAPAAPSQYFGKAIVFSGADGSIVQEVSEPNPYQHGFPVESAGDFDGDGVADFVVGNQAVGFNSAGGFYVYSGATFQVLSSGIGQVAYAGVSYAYDFACIGDIDGDGDDEIAVGNPGALGSNNFTASGTVSIAGLAEGNQEGEGSNPWDYFGYSVAGMGDVNGDGVPDLAVGAPTEPGNLLSASTSVSRAEVLYSPCLETIIYCSATLNSAGVAARISASGTGSVSALDFRLLAFGIPTSVSGLFFFGPNQATPPTPFGDGFLCVSAPLVRLFPPQVSLSPLAAVTRTVDFTSFPGDKITPGSTWNFQYWYRDPTGPGGTGFNVSEAMSVTFCD